jgi:hypothetical protein
LPESGKVVRVVERTKITQDLQMDQNSKEKTLEILTKAETILIAISEDSGFDGLAAGLAIFLSCQKLGKNVSVFTKPPQVSDAKTLYGVDKIGKPAGKKNLVVVVENAVQNVDKVTYFLDGDKLKIVIHSFHGTTGISQEQLKFKQTTSKPDLIFSIGHKSIEDLERLITHEQNIDSTVWMVNINREDMNQKFAQVVVSNPQAASISEITGQILQDLALPIDQDIAFNLFVGIADATSNFSPAKSSPTSFQTAAWLVKFGAGKASLANQLSKTFQESNFSNPPFISGLQPKPHPKTAIFYKEEDWLKPPKIYKGSKSFDSKN